MSSICSKKGKRRRQKSIGNPQEMEEIRDAEIRRREYKTPQQIDQESKYVYGNDVYTVSKILAKRLCNGKKEYLIKWHGYSKSDATWEPASNILDRSVITKFEAKHTVQINVSHEDVKKASSALDEDDEETPRRRKRKKAKGSKKHHKRRRSHGHSPKKRKLSSSEDEKQEKEASDEKNELLSEARSFEDTPAHSDSISQDGDTSSEEIAEEPLSEKEMTQWNTFAEARLEISDRESEGSNSCSLSEIRDIVDMMTERVAMEIEGNQDINTCGLEFDSDLNNNEVLRGPEISQSIETPPSESGVEKDELRQKAQVQGTILGSALRSDTRVYLVKWSTGTRQVLTQTEVKEKWPQLLIKFYESNIHWLKKLK